MAGYGTDERFLTYAAENGYTVPPGSIPAARQRGSAYLDAVYGDRYPGVPLDGIEQDRAWPRDDATDIYGNVIEGIPNRIEKASYEATLLELITPGSLSVLISENERIKSIKAGSVSIEYANGTTGSTVVAGAYPMSTAIEGLLYPILGTTDVTDLPAILVV